MRCCAENQKVAVGFLVACSLDKFLCGELSLLVEEVGNVE